MQAISSPGEHNRERWQRANKLASSSENPKHPKNFSSRDRNTSKVSGKPQLQAPMFSDHRTINLAGKIADDSGNSSSAPDDPVAMEEVVEETQSLGNQHVLARINGGDFRQGGNDFLLNLRNGSLRHRNQHILIVFLQES
nr:hypothetical protein Itr_chr14CG08390 [Ipomoea trifida]